MSQWIKLEEQAPPLGRDDIWLCDRTGRVFDGFAFDGGYWADLNEGYPYFKTEQIGITHWMPKEYPEPPQEYLG